MFKSATHLFSGTLASLLLAACTVGPNHVRPTIVTQARFDRPSATAAAAAIGNGPDAAAAAVGLGGEAQFWRALGDPQLNTLVEQTLLANHDLRIALSRYDAANALLRGASLDRLPTLTAGASASDGRASADQAPGPSRDQRDRRSFAADLRLSWELDLFGRIRRGIEAEHAQVGESAAELRAMQVSVVAEVASEYVRLRGLQSRLQVARQNAQSQAGTLRLVDSGLTAGRGTEFDSARARAQLESTSSRLPALETQIALTLHRLSVLSGQQPGALVARLGQAGPLPALPAAIDPGTPGELLRRRPDVAAAEYRLHAATARIGVATADLFPRFTLGGLLGSQSVASGGLFRRDSETGFVALGVDWSFLDAGRVRARIAASHAEAEGELARYQQTVLRALEETANALATYDNGRLEDQYLQRAAEDSARAAELARVRQQAGAGTLLEVLDAQRSQLQAQDAFAQGRARSIDGLIQVYRAVAGGWPSRLPRREPIAGG